MIAIAARKDAFSRHNPGYPFDHFFIDAAYERKFNDEQRLGTLSREFLILVGLASLVAVLLSWYLTEEWLQTSSYRMGIPWTVFAATAGGRSS